MKTSSCKAKGRDLQKHISQTIVESFSQLGADDVVSRPMGSPGVDVMLSPLAQEVFPISVESKNTRTKPGPGELKQAEYNTYPGTVAAVAWKPHGKPKSDTMVMMKLTAVIDLIKKVRDEDYSTGQEQQEPSGVA